MCIELLHFRVPPRNILCMARSTRHFFWTPRNPPFSDFCKQLFLKVVDRRPSLQLFSLKRKRQAHFLLCIRICVWTCILYETKVNTLISRRRVKYHVPFLSSTLPLWWLKTLCPRRERRIRTSGLLWCHSRVSLCTNYFRVVWCSFCIGVLSHNCMWTAWSPNYILRLMI